MVSKWPYTLGENFSSLLNKKSIYRKKKKKKKKKKKTNHSAHTNLHSHPVFKLSV